MPHTVSSSAPIFYLVRRGSAPGTLDHALKLQALESGIEIRFGSRCRHASGSVIVAEGLHRANVIATGYVFDTDMEDGCYAAIADRLAPAGYGYLLVEQGRGTVATCIFERFHEEREHLEKTVEFFRRQVGLRWYDAKRFGGSGNFDLVRAPTIGQRLYVGESAGFQDALFGFGLRYALTSGHFAGRARGSAAAYDDHCRLKLNGLNAASCFNRWLYTQIGDRGRRAVLRHAVRSRNPRRMLRRIYAPAHWKTTLARLLAATPLVAREHIRGDCDCTWCRCCREADVSGEKRPRRTQ